MIYARETISEFIKAQVALMPQNIMTPALRFSVRSNSQPPEFPNCLNLYMYDDKAIQKTNPAYRLLTASLELMIEVNPSIQMQAETQAYTAMHLINQFMAVQTTPKINYGVVPPKKLGSAITWRDSYPVDWISTPNIEERYVQKSASLQFKYWEEPITA